MGSKLVSITLAIGLLGVGYMAGTRAQQSDVMVPTASPTVAAPRLPFVRVLVTPAVCIAALDDASNLRAMYLSDLQAAVQNVEIDQTTLVGGFLPEYQAPLNALTLKAANDAAACRS